VNGFASRETDVARAEDPPRSEALRGVPFYLISVPMKRRIAIASGARQWRGGGETRNRRSELDGAPGPMRNSVSSLLRSEYSASVSASYSS